MTDMINTTEPTTTIPYDEVAAPTAITVTEYGGLQAAYDHFNEALFEGELPNVFITYQRKAHSAGHFAANRFSGRVGQSGQHELAINPDGFVGQSDQQVMQTLVHEMAHTWQHAFGQPSARGYHNEQWATKMEEIGLQPTSTGMVDGKRTGQRMSDYPIAGGRFLKAFADLEATGWQLNLESARFAGGTKAPTSKLKYTCRDCKANAWGKPNSGFVCKACLLGALCALPWIGEDMATDLCRTIDAKTMMPPKTDTDAASSRDEGDA